MMRKQISARLSDDVIRMRDELLEFFNSHQPIGKVTSNDVIELAIKELYENYLGKRESASEHYGVK